MLTNYPDKSYRLLAYAVLAVVAAFILMTFRHYGVSWDEEIQSQYGQAVYDYYASGLMDQRYNEIFNLYLYGGMFDGLAAFVNEYTPFSVYDTRHLLNALIGLLGLWGTWRVGRLVGGGFVGLAALVMLAVTPMYYGHIFTNPKDIPFACGVIWSLYYMIRILFTFPKPSLAVLVKLGIIYGLTLGIRVNGIMVLGHFALVLGVMALFRTKPRTPRDYAITLYHLLRIGLFVFVLSYIVMLLCWPWAQQAPLVNPLRAIKEFSNFPQHVEVLLRGETYMSTDLPWSYVPEYFFIQLPIMQLILIVTGLFMLPVAYAHLGVRGKRSALGLMALTVFFPVLYAVFYNPALYDAVRHFIFILPPLCILGALALREIVIIAHYRLSQMQREALLYAGYGGGCFIILLGLFLPFQAMVRLHPYEYIYTNELVGGVDGAFGQYELDYWGSSFKEAVEKLNNFVGHEGGVPAGTIYKVAICGPWSAAEIYLPPDYEAVEANAPADFFLSTTRWMCHEMRDGKAEVVRVARMGVPLSVVKDLRGTEEGRLGMPNYREEQKKLQEGGK